MDTMQFTKCVGQGDGEKKWGEKGFATLLATSQYHKPGSTAVYVGFGYDMPLPCHTEGTGSTGEPKANVIEGLSLDDSIAAWTEILTDDATRDERNKALFNGLKLTIAMSVVPDSTQRKITDADKGWWCMNNLTAEQMSGKAPADLLKLYDAAHAG